MAASVALPAPFTVKDLEHPVQSDRIIGPAFLFSWLFCEPIQSTATAISYRVLSWATSQMLLLQTLGLAGSAKRTAAGKASARRPLRQCGQASFLQRPRRFAEPSIGSAVPEVQGDGIGLGSRKRQRFHLDPSSPSPPGSIPVQICCPGNAPRSVVPTSRRPNLLFPVNSLCTWIE